MAARASHFTDATQYHGFMARWSRAAGGEFLDWLAPPADAAWLDIGCGSGAFTQLIGDRCKAKSIAAIDPASSQVAKARTIPITPSPHFCAASAEVLPFRNDSFDIVVSALALNFISDPPKAVREMSRVLRRTGIAAGYVWDLETALSPTWPIAAALKTMGLSPAASIGRQHTSLAALRALFDNNEFQHIDVSTFDIELGFPDFDTYWVTQTPSFHPFGKIIAGMDEADRARTQAVVRQTLKVEQSGRVVATARANAIKAVKRN